MPRPVPDVYDSGAAYAVVLTRKGDGIEYFARGHGAAPATFWRRPDAVKFRDELHRGHGLPKGRVVKVWYAVTTDTGGRG